MIHDDYEAWPEISVSRPAQGAILYTKYGKIAGYMHLDGHVEYKPRMSDIDVQTWEAFGVSEHEHSRLESAVTDLINQLAGRREKV